MANEPRNPRSLETQEGGGGSPANEAAAAPTEEELDQRQRSKAKPRRAAGPPLAEAAPGARDAVEETPPASTDPDQSDGGSDGGADDGAPQAAGSTAAGDAGAPVDHAPPKPSADELDRRDRMKSGPRRAAGPPLEDGDAEEFRAAPDVPPPPATDPEL